MRRRTIYDKFIVIALAIITVVYFVYSNNNSESGSLEYYQQALEAYKNTDYETAYKIFGKIKSNSVLKSPALFRQARCATNMQKPEIAIKKYNKILSSKSKTSIVPISEYNMANIFYEEKKYNEASKHFKKIIKQHPNSDYAIASEYYLGKIRSESINKNPKRNAKNREFAANHFRTYMQKSPEGRFSVKSAEALQNLGVELDGYDNLLIAQVYYNNGEYENSKKFLSKTNVAESWVDFAKVEYKLGNKEKLKEYAELGLKNYSDNSKNEDTYEVIDMYIKSSLSRVEGIKSLVSLQTKSTGADYINYLQCNELVAADKKDECYQNLYKTFPNGQFAAEALYNLFISKYLQKKYYEAQRLGFLHIKKFSNAKSSPAVNYYMGKIANKLKYYDNANNYFKKVLKDYPDSYYAFRAYYNLNKDDGFLPFLELTVKPVVFPYKKSLDNNLVIRLAHLQDYDLVDELCKKDKFVQSWIAYKKGDFTVSSILARDAMEELQTKPDFTDLRWRLIYPTHYYDQVVKVKNMNNPIIIESIIKEESHFNPYATSSVGAKGLMQLMPSTYNEIAQKYGISQSIDSVYGNILAGSLYYSTLSRVLGSKDIYVISAYNGGLGSLTSWLSKIKYNDVDEFVEQIPYPETKNYVKKVLKSYWLYGNIY